MSGKLLLIVTLWLGAQLGSGYGKDIRSMVKRSVDITTGPYYNSSLVEQHQFAWRGGPPSGSALSFEDHLRGSLGPNDFLYIFTGDTQHWTPCTPSNTGCQRATDGCSTRRQSSAVECNQRQSEYANKMQQISMAALNRKLNQAVGRQAISGLIINGDLTEFGHNDELTRMKTLWTSTKFDNVIKVYPGLGNHDYANNVGECTLDHCVNRMLRWFRSFVKDTLKLPLDLRTSTKYMVSEDNSGSFAYSWDECVDHAGPSRSCFHFVQLNNYPTYTKHVDGWVFSWKILSALNWLANDLRREGANKPVIINFHDFDNGFSLSDKAQFQKVLETATASSNIRVLAIFFAHIHDQVGVKQHWCIGGRRVPLLYSGSVPGNNYILGHFSADSGNTKALYTLRVQGDAVTYVEPTTVPEEQDRCTVISNL